MMDSDRITQTACDSELQSRSTSSSLYTISTAVRDNGFTHKKAADVLTEKISLANNNNRHRH
jgi:hypothetical protein